MQLGLGDEMFLHRAGRFKATEQREKKKRTRTKRQDGRCCLNQKVPILFLLRKILIIDRKCDEKIGWLVMYITR